MFNSSFVSVCTLLGHIPFASDKLNSWMRPTEPDVSAWPSRDATCSGSTSSSFRSGSPSGLKQIVKNT